MNATVLRATRANALLVETRRVWRLLRVVEHIGRGFLLALMLGAFWQPRRPVVRRVTRAWLARLLDILAVRVEVRGRPARGPVFLVSNHVSWLDIPVLGAQRNLYFLSKAEVRDWPLIGSLAAATGTLFIRRGAGQSKRKAEEIARHLRRGRGVLVFPEGTTTDGTGLRRFFPQLFAAPVMADVAVQPVALRYLDESGDADTGVAFIGEDAFHTHLWSLLRRPEIRVRLVFCEPVRMPGQCKEQVSRRVHAQIKQALD